MIFAIAFTVSLIGIGLMGVIFCICAWRQNNRNKAIRQRKDEEQYEVVRRLRK